VEPPRLRARSPWSASFEIIPPTNQDADDRAISRNRADDERGVREFATALSLFCTVGRVDVVAYGPDENMSIDALSNDELIGVMVRSGRRSG